MLTEARGKIPLHQSDVALGLTMLQLAGDHPSHRHTAGLSRSSPLVTRT